MPEPTPPEHDSEAWTGKHRPIHRPEPPASESYTVLSHDPETWRRIQPTGEQHDTALADPIMAIVVAFLPVYLLLGWLVGDVGVLTGGLVSSIGGEVLKPALSLILCILLVMGVYRRLPRKDSPPPHPSPKPPA